MNDYFENVRQKQDAERALREEEESTAVNRIRIDDSSARIMLMSDEHIGNLHYNNQLHMQVLETAYNKGMYILHLGDMLESATRNSVGDSVYTQEEIVDHQISHGLSLYEPFAEADRMLGYHPGNHELRMFKDDGVNVCRHMARKMGCKYLGIAKVHLIRVGNQTYTMYTTHGASGARMPHTKIKSAIDLEKIVDTEIYAMGHLHQKSHHVREFYAVDKRNKTLRRESKHFILTGSYLDYWGSYAQVKSMEPARLGSPVLFLNGEEHQIKVELQ